MNCGGTSKVSFSLFPFQLDCSRFCQDLVLGIHVLVLFSWSYSQLIYSYHIQVNECLADISEY